MKSNCCGADLLPETDICSDCLEHCDPIEDADYIQSVLDISNNKIYMNSEEVK